MPRGEKEKILVVCVDRDNDLGEKTSLKGPLIGKEMVLKGASELGLADPTDSDANSMFQAVKVFEEMRKQYRTEVAVLTGHKNVGIQSDREITGQLDQVLGKFKADYAVLVTDGAEDENIMPIIQSKIPILSVSRVVVKQAEQLESSYYKLKDFIEESLDNPKFARLVFGLPAVALILYALFGIEGWRAIVGIFGLYLLIKGFKLEHYFYSVAEELQSSFTRRRFAFFMYIVAFAFLAFASYRGYETMLNWTSVGFFEAVASFVSASVYFYFLAAAIAWVGRGISREKRKRRIIAAPVFGFAIALVIYNAAELILRPEVSAFNFLLAIAIGFVLLFIALVIEWKS